MQLLRPVLVAGLAFASLTACNDDDPAPRSKAARTSFEANPYAAERVLEMHRKEGNAERVVTLPAGTREISVSLDCAGSSGELQVTFSTLGGAGVPCPSESGGKGAFVVLAGDGSLAPRQQRITVAGPYKGQWSVAVDAGAKVTAP